MAVKKQGNENNMALLFELENAEIDASKCVENDQKEFIYSK